MNHNLKSIYERLDALKSAHPDMIWKYHSLNGVNIGKDDRTYVYIKCVCPEDYTVWGFSSPEPHCVLSSMYTLEDGLYTILGAKRKIGYLEQMVWTRFDAIASKARLHLSHLQNELGVVNNPLSDGYFIRTNSAEKKIKG